MTIGDAARICRSKNAGMALLTLDVAFDDQADYEAARRALSPERVAPLYGVEPDAVQIICWDCAKTIKVTLPRHPRSGGPGDRDVYGCQQHVPIRELALVPES
jgi:hypothetical protein